VTGKETEVAFPATSEPATTMVLVPTVRVTLQDRLDWASVAAAPLQVTPAIPESASVTVPETARGDVVTVAPDAGALMAIVGAVLSILSVTVAVAVLPALSDAVRERT
jgi:hypothetical protein